MISGADGVQGHVETLWKLLGRYQIPTFLFINKMDQPGTDRGALLGELMHKLDEHCVDFGPLLEETCGKSGGSERQSVYEELAMCEEELLEHYLEHGDIPEEEIRRLVVQRKVFPCYFGSALRLEGVTELLDGVCRYAAKPEYQEEFGARVFKIARDAQSSRLTYMKITGGTLRVKTLLSNRGKVTEEEKIWEEKADQIRIYSGDSYQAVQEAAAGTVCAVTGLGHTYAGEGLGAEKEAELPILEPVLSYRIELPDDCDVHRTFLKLRELEEEEPQLHLVWDEQLSEIHAQLMGEVQTEILQNMIRERFGIAVRFGEGNIVYKETIRGPVEGVGHFEPLRHYAEVHLLLEPAERGSGLQVASACSTDVLDTNWQRLILTHVEERQHRGVLTGSEITDMRITLLTGRAHQKHTEGGDFRQATYRAVRHGLKCAESVLLEPYYEFKLEVPNESVGRALSDIQRMHGTFETPEPDGEYTVISGMAPVVTMRGYQTELLAYTKGRGRLSCALKGYEECHNTEEVLAQREYDSEHDLEHPTGSVFCAHGAGFVVPWYQVRDYMHVESGWHPEDGSSEQEEMEVREELPDKMRYASTYSGAVDEEELEAIFMRTYGPVKRERSRFLRSHREDAGVRTRPAKREAMEECLLVDGYNIIFAWDDLKELARENIEAARGKLMDILSNYQGYRSNHLILVFDAYRVAGGVGEIFKYHNIHVVYTKEAETADQYIEKTVREIGKKYHVTVATSDALEQIIIFGAGASRMSANDLRTALEEMNRDLHENYMGRPSGGKAFLGDVLPEGLEDLPQE